MFRGERPIKPGNSWFSAKTIEVVPRVNTSGVEHWMDAGVAEIYQTLTKLRIPMSTTRETDGGC